MINVNGVRIAGLSGIYKGYNYCKGRFEKPPYDKNTLRSVYHIRNVDVFRLKQLRNSPPDIVMSHDWPNGIHKHGDGPSLLRRKPFFKEDIDTIKIIEWPELIDTNITNRLELRLNYLEKDNEREFRLAGYGRWKDINKDEL